MSSCQQKRREKSWEKAMKSVTARQNGGKGSSELVCPFFAPREYRSTYHAFTILSGLCVSFLAGAA